MSIKNCFQEAHRLGVITTDELKQLSGRFDELAKTTLDTAELRARMQTEIEAEAKHRERAALLTQVALDRIDQTLAGWVDRKGERNDVLGFQSMHENVGGANLTGAFMQDAEGLHRALFNEAVGKLSTVMHELSRGAIMGDLSRTASPWRGGSRKKQIRMDNMAREVMGEATGDPIAKAMATAVTDTLEDLRIKFNAAGGAIGKLEGGYLPQWHNAKALEDFGRERYVRHMMRDADLDRARMKDHVTGQPLTDADLRRALETMWERAVTEGWVDIDVNQPDHRFIHFKTADAYLAYAKRFGSPDLFGALMGHISGMTRDIAHMQTFGPNPNRTREIVKAKLQKAAAERDPTAIIIHELGEKIEAFQAEAALLGPSRSANLIEHYRAATDRYLMATDDTARAEAMADLSRLRDEIDKAAVSDGTTSRRVEIAKEIATLVSDMREPVKATRRAIDYTNSVLARSDAMWESMRGAPVVNRKLAERMRSARNFISATSLPSAWISSLTDPAAGQDARLRLGMAFGKSNVGRVMVATLKDMITSGNRQLAADSMLGLDAAQNVLMRRAAEVSGWDHQFWTGWIADRTLTWGLLSPWTQAGKHVFGVDFMRHMGGLAAKPFKELPAGLRSVLQSQGFGEAEWSRIQGVPRHEGLLRPNEIMATDRELGLRYIQMIRREMLQAVPESTVESRSWVTDTKAGTIAGEAIRSAAQFKGFAMAVFQLKLAGIARDIISGNPTRIGLGVAYLVTSTILGAMVMALKDVKDGRDPRKWLDEKFYLDPKMWGAAFLQAGGLGIYGDLLFSEVNRFGGGLASTVAGPLVGRVGDVLDVTAEIKAAMEGKKTNFTKYGVKQLRRNVPFFNHWAVSLIYQRMVMDTLQRMGDPEGAAGLQRQMAKRRKDYGQDYYWRMGDTAPSRAPDLTRILATR